MPGKHAPASPWSFVLSLARAAAGALAVLGVVVLIAFVAVNSRGDTGPAAGGTPTPTTSPDGEPTATGSPTPTTSPSVESSPTPRPPGEVTVQVLNGNGRTGVAGEVTSALEQAGYQALEASNASIRARTIILFRRGFRPDALALREAHFPYAAAGQVMRSDDGPGEPEADIVVVLGQDQPSG